jgi:hypothetical protein
VAAGLAHGEGAALRTGTGSGDSHSAHLQSAALELECNGATGGAAHDAEAVEEDEEEDSQDGAENFTSFF